MRVSSLSDPRNISLISHHFVPTWLSRDAYQLARPSREEADLVARIDADRRAKKLPGGAVCVYIVTPVGEVVATLPVQQASKPDRLAAFLRQVIAEKDLPSRKPITQTMPSRPRPTRPDGRLFTLWTRFDSRSTNRGTSRDVVELSRDDWKAFLPPTAPRTDLSWTIPPGTAGRLLRHAYPPLPHWKASQGKLEEATLRVRITEQAEDGLRLRLEGNLDLIYPHLGRPTDGRVSARLVGVARTDRKVTRLESFLLISQDGRYSWGAEGRRQTQAMSLAVELEP